MGKFFLRFFLLVLIVVASAIIFLSYFGLETDKFDSFIKSKANEVNENVKLEFNKTKIQLDISDLKLLLKLQNPKVLLKNNEINLSKLDLFLSLKSFYTSDFLLEKATLAFEKNDIKDLTKITNIFLPKIINKQLNKIFAKGNLEGEFIIPFKPDGTVSKNYTFYGKVMEADINITEDYRLKNLTAEVGYGANSLIDTDGLRIIINKGTFLNLELLKSLIDIKFKENKKFIRSSIHTKGNINSSEIKKITSLLGSKTNYFEDINLTSDLTTNIEFNIDERFRVGDMSYVIQGDISSLQIKIKEKKAIKEFIPSFNPEITLKNSKIDFKALNGIGGDYALKLEGEVKFDDKFEKIKITQRYKKKNKKYSIIGSSTLAGSSINISKLNYKKEKDENAYLTFNTNFILDKYFLIDYLSYSDDQSEITLNKIKLNKNLEVINLEALGIKTYVNKVKNNDFSIKKSDQVIISGEIFDAEPLLKSLYKKSERKTFSKDFKSEIKINFDKVISGTNDDVSDFAMIVSINKGSYDKLSLKGNFSKNEIVEMSIYQVDKDKKTLQLISDRARPFIKNFDFIKGFEDGKLEYESIISKKGSNSNLKITDFKVSKVPALAKLLTLASLQGIADTLSGEGIRFESFEMKSNSEGNVINIEDALAIGPAISILLEGYVDKGKIVSLRGTLVPATKLNSIIASIPVVGNILVGKKIGEGVVGVSFKMKGPPKAIKTTVNPIKTLTPRFIVRAIEKLKKPKKEETK